MDVSWLTSLSTDLQTLISGASGDYFGGLGSTITLRLLDIAGYQIRRRFESPEKNNALCLTISEALVTTLREWTDDETLLTHYLNLFDELTKRENVAGEISQLLDPRPDTVLNVELLVSEFEALDYDAEWLGLDFGVFLQKFTTAFFNATSRNETLRPLIDSPPYTFFSLNDDMELNRYREPFVQKMLKNPQSQLK